MQRKNSLFPSFTRLVLMVVNRYELARKEITFYFVVKLGQRSNSDGFNFSHFKG